MSSAQIINIFIIVTVFGLVFSVWCICVFLWLGKYLMHISAIQKRLGIVAKESEEAKTLRLWRGIQQESGAVAAAPKVSIKERLDGLGKDVGWTSPAYAVITGVIGVAFMGFVTTYILGGGILFGTGVALAVLAVFYAYTVKRFNQREALFEKQLLSALGIASRALRAGHPLVGAFQLVADEIGDPLGDVFYRICNEQQLGMDLKDSIHKIARTTRNSELKLFATAVAIQFKSGGNLADIMDTLSSIIRARIRLNRRIRVLTAQTQIGKRILIALPIVLFFLLNIINPKYMEPLYTTSAGKLMLGVMILSVLFGSWVMHRMSVVRY